MISSAYNLIHVILLFCAKFKVIPKGLKSELKMEHQNLKYYNNAHHCPSEKFTTIFNYYIAH